MYTNLLAVSGGVLVLCILACTPALFMTFVLARRQTTNWWPFAGLAAGLAIGTARVLFVLLQLPGSEPDRAVELLADPGFGDLFLFAGWGGLAGFLLWAVGRWLRRPAPTTS